MRRQRDPGSEIHVSLPRDGTPHWPVVREVEYSFVDVGRGTVEHLGRGPTINESSAYQFAHGSAHVPGFEAQQESKGFNTEKQGFHGTERIGALRAVLNRRPARSAIFLLREISAFPAFRCWSLAFLNHTRIRPAANHHRTPAPNQHLVANDSHEKRVDSIGKNRPG